VFHHIALPRLGRLERTGRQTIQQPERLHPGNGAPSTTVNSGQAIKYAASTINSTPPSERSRTDVSASAST
jgi:hypothetical protein